MSMNLGMLLRGQYPSGDKKRAMPTGPNSPIPVSKRPGVLSHRCPKPF